MQVSNAVWKGGYDGHCPDFLGKSCQDGLVRDDVHRIWRDSCDYLWFGTAEGLSVFDVV